MKHAPEDLLQPVLEIAHDAGRRILEIYESDFAVEAKEDRSPLTEADMASHREIVAGLRRLTPDIPVLSEESGQIPYEERRRWQEYWLVDPLDGTREFIHRTGEFTINIALIEQGVAVLGVIAEPLADRIYLGVPGYRAGCYRDGDFSTIAISSRPVDRVRVLTSSRYHGAALKRCLEQLQESFGAVEKIQAGSALKFCRLAEGRGDIYPRFSPCCEWDTAAGQALVEAAGGAVVNLQFEPLRYNAGSSVASPHFYALGDPEVDWREVLEI